LNGSTSSSETQAPAPKPVEDTPVRFTLTGPSRSYDPVHQAIRADLADVAEADHHFAPHYAEPVMCKASAAVELRERPAGDAVARASLVEGAAFALLDLTGGWAWGYAVEGHIVGYVRRELLEIA
jgi:hypothetical protein